MRISKRSEEAARICSILASGSRTCFLDAAESIGATWQAMDLCANALCYARREMKHADWSNHEAEAESLIRCGWSPS